jgi:hypothetical protein
MKYQSYSKSKERSKIRLVWSAKILKDYQFDYTKRMEMATHGNLHREGLSKVERNEDEDKLS